MGLKPPTRFAGRGFLSRVRYPSKSARTRSSFRQIIEQIEFNHALTTEWTLTGSNRKNHVIRRRFAGGTPAPPRLPQTRREYPIPPTIRHPAENIQFRRRYIIRARISYSADDSSPRREDDIPPTMHHPAENVQCRR